MGSNYETSVRVIVEFRRSSESGVGRVIRFNHGPDMLPSQLIGRVAKSTWHAFMIEVDLLAQHHPYVQRPGAKDVGGWAACFALGSVVGVCCVNPDAGDYGEWEEEARNVVHRFQGQFRKGGCLLSLQKSTNYWMQIDIDPNSPLVELNGEEPPKDDDSSSRSYLSPFQSTRGGYLEDPNPDDSGKKSEH